MAKKRIERKSVRVRVEAKGIAKPREAFRVNDIEAPRESFRVNDIEAPASSFKIDRKK